MKTMLCALCFSALLLLGAGCFTTGTTRPQTPQTPLLMSNGVPVHLDMQPGRAQ